MTVFWRPDATISKKKEKKRKRNDQKGVYPHDDVMACRRVNKIRE